jgi:hypothetical protein
VVILGIVVLTAAGSSFVLLIICTVEAMALSNLTHRSPSAPTMFENLDKYYREKYVPT